MGTGNWTIGTDVATMIGSTSVVTATVAYVSTHRRAWRTRVADRRKRSWETGYVMMTNVHRWAVRLAGEDQGRGARVVLEVLGSKGGEPDEQMAFALRQVVREQGFLSQQPSAEQARFLRDLELARRRNGFPVL
jgi:hypothetical protein